MSADGYASPQTENYIGSSQKKADQVPFQSAEMYLPQKKENVDLNIDAIRAPGEKFCLVLIWIFNVFLLLPLSFLL